MQICNNLIENSFIKTTVQIVKKCSKPCLAAVGVGASFLLLELHFSNETDGLRSTKGWGASTSQGANGRDIAAPVTGPQRGSEKLV